MNFPIFGSLKNIFSSGDTIRFSMPLAKAKQILIEGGVECWYEYSLGDYHYILVPSGQRSIAENLLQRRKK